MLLNIEHDTEIDSPQDGPGGFLQGSILYDINRDTRGEATSVNMTGFMVGKAVLSVDVVARAVGVDAIATWECDRFDRICEGERVDEFEAPSDFWKEAA